MSVTVDMWMPVLTPIVQPTPTPMNIIAMLPQTKLQPTTSQVAEKILADKWLPTIVFPTFYR